MAMLQSITINSIIEQIPLLHGYHINWREKRALAGELNEKLPIAVHGVCCIYIHIFSFLAYVHIPESTLGILQTRQDMVVQEIFALQPWKCQIQKLSSKKNKTALSIRRQRKRTGYCATSARERLLEFCLTKLLHALALEVIQVICLDEEVLPILVR